MDSNRNTHVKLAPLNGVVDPARVRRSKDRNRLKGGCTNLMYACQQGLTDTIVKEVRSQVNTAGKLTEVSLRTSKRKYLDVNYMRPKLRSKKMCKQLSCGSEKWVTVRGGGRLFMGMFVCV